MSHRTIRQMSINKNQKLRLHKNIKSKRKTAYMQTKGYKNSRFIVEMLKNDDYRLIDFLIASKDSSLM